MAEGDTGDGVGGTEAEEDEMVELRRRERDEENSPHVRRWGQAARGFWRDRAETPPSLVPPNGSLQKQGRRFHV